MSVHLSTALSQHEHDHPRRAAPLGVVVIGRNEEPHLRRCLASIDDPRRFVVYVDSNSSDSSVELVESLGIPVVELDTAQRLTAARGRNAGVDYLLLHRPDIQFIQFLDGDCELIPDWLGEARRTLESRDDAVAVCGRQWERYPQRSVYQRLMAIELDIPVGVVSWCGGNFMVRAAAFRRTGGFNAELAAGEEPELCLRLRRDGGEIISLPAPMIYHDAEMIRFGQWWRRTARTGFGYAEAAWLHGTAPERHGVRSLASILLWALLLPVVAAGLTWLVGARGLVLFSVYPVQWLRIVRDSRGRSLSRSDATCYATFTLVGKFANLIGVTQFLRSLIFRRRKTGEALPVVHESRGDMSSVSRHSGS